MTKCVTPSRTALFVALTVVRSAYAEERENFVWVPERKGDTAIIRMLAFDCAGPPHFPSPLRSFRLTQDGDAGGASKATLTVLNDREGGFYELQASNLSPGERYKYTLNGYISGSFRALPREDASITFLAAGNTYDEKRHMEVAKAMGSVDADVVIHTGNYADDHYRWRGYFSIAEYFGSHREVLGAIGYRELREPLFLDDYVRLFGPSGADRSDADSLRRALVRSERVGHVAFFFFGELDGDGFAKDLTRLSELMAASLKDHSVRWRIAVMPQIPLSEGLDAGTPNGLRLSELLAASKVDLVLSSQSLVYERSVRRGIRTIMTGGVKPTVDVDAGSPALFSPFLIARTDRDQLTLEAKQVNGELIERCTIQKTRPGFVCDGENTGAAPPLNPIAPSGGPWKTNGMMGFAASATLLGVALGLRKRLRRR
ncbi:MAG: hypothetical protein KBF88_16940 [Polyangiaceae bacterium]|nr:hypothetical protein [Polyangiaceae bacterium]